MLYKKKVKSKLKLEAVSWTASLLDLLHKTVTKESVLPSQKEHWLEHWTHNHKAVGTQSHDSRLQTRRGEQEYINNNMLGVVKWVMVAIDSLSQI